MERQEMNNNNNGRKNRNRDRKDNRTKPGKRTGSKPRRSGVCVCAVYFVLVGLVVGLAVKNYHLSGRLDDALARIDELEGGASATATDGREQSGEVGTDGQNTENDDVTDQDKSGADTQADSAQTTETEALIVSGEVEYKDTVSATESTESTEEPTDIDGTDGENTDTTTEIDMATYNGDDLADNGHQYAIKVNRQENIVTVYSLDADGYYTVPVKAMRCSVSPTGATETGLFNISGKWNWLALFDNCYGQYVSQIIGDTLFHSVPYLDTTKDSLETWEFNKLGTSASLGCVRLCVADVKWIYENCDTGTYVNIFDSDYYGPLGRPVPVTKLENTDEEGWDPTDMDEANPYAGKAALYGVESHSIQLGENYDTMAGVWAFNSQMEDVTESVTVTGSVDNTKAGDYTIKYSFMDGDEEYTQSIVITVEDNEAPVIAKVPVSLTVLGYEGQTKELAELVASYITATDNGGKITKAYAVNSAGKTEDGVRATELGENAICVDVSGIKVTKSENREEGAADDTTSGDTADSTFAGEYTVSCYAVDASGNKSSYYVVKVVCAK